MNLSSTDSKDQVREHHRVVKKEKWNDEHYRITNEKYILIGESSYFECPGFVKVEEVFQEIPAWQEIQERDLGEENPEYWSLLSRANRQFYRALHQVKKRTGHDLITRGTALKPVIDNAPVPCDMTEIIIRQLQNNGNSALETDRGR